MEKAIERDYHPLTDPADLTARERAARLDALARADDYGAVIRWHREHPAEDVGTGAVLTMLEQNYLVRVAEMWRIYQASDLAGQGSGEGSGQARNNALRSLQLLSDEDTKLTNILKDFGRIVPKSLQLHGKSKDTLDALRELKKVADQGAAQAPKRPRGRPRKLLKAPIPPILPDPTPTS